MTRLTDGPTLVTGRKARKPFLERLQEHRKAIRDAQTSSDTVRYSREDGAIVIGYAKRTHRNRKPA